MRAILLRLCALLALLGLYACDGEALRRLKPGVSTESELRALLGEPGMEWRNSNGSRTLEFSRQPEGETCYMATVGPDGILASLEQVLTEENLARIRPGMDRDAVRRLLGKPREMRRFGTSPDEVWRWKVGKEVMRDRYFDVRFGPDGLAREAGFIVDVRG